VTTCVCARTHTGKRASLSLSISLPPSLSFSLLIFWRVHTFVFCTHAYACIHARIQVSYTQAHAYIHTQAHAYMHTHKNITYSYIHTRTSHTHTYTQEHHILIHTHKNITYSYIHTRTSHTHTYTQEHHILIHTQASKMQRNTSMRQADIHVLCAHAQTPHTHTHTHTHTQTHAHTLAHTHTHTHRNSA
jgi:hypothetical protein